MAHRCAPARDAVDDHHDDPGRRFDHHDDHDDGYHGYDGYDGYDGDGEDDGRW